MPSLGPGGPVVVALSAGRGHGGRLRLLEERHMTGLRVVALDLRGSGRSTHLDVTVTRMDSGHTVYIDRPGQTGAVVQEFLG